VLFERLAAIAQATSVPCLEPVLALLRVRQPDAPAELTTAWLTAFESRTAAAALPSVLIPEARVPDIQGLEIVTWAQVRRAQGETRVVETRLEGFLSELVRQGRHGTALEVRPLLATLHWEGDRREQAVAVLEPALTLAEQEGYVRVFAEAGPAVAPVLRQAAAQGIAPEFVGKLLAALDKRVGAPLVGARPSLPVTAAGSPALIEPLSDRELEVLRLVAAGMANKEIAEQLFLAVGTVKRHVFNLYGKLGVTSRMSAVARARDLGLL
jgi:LuxR family maltose regulon positive regulatory protein